MGQLSDTLFSSVPGLLEACRDQDIFVPENLQNAVNTLMGKLQHALKGDEELLRENLERLFPEMWSLRFECMSFLADLEMVGTLRKIEYDLESVATSIPELQGTVERLHFGLELMIDFLTPLLRDISDFTRKVTEEKTGILSDYDCMIARIGAMNIEQANTIISLMQSSLMIELLLFAIIQTDKNHQVPNTSVCHELQYLSAEAVEQYAKALGVKKTQLPWYSVPKSDFQSFLLGGPVATNEELQLIKEKQSHLNSWK
ncbi:MAG: hypothetical protein ACKOCO_07720 [Bacteroidota bacterium]